MSSGPRVFRGLELPASSVEALGDRGGEVELRGLEHGGGPYDVRIFLNNADADADTERSEASGYAGTIHVYGAGGEPGASTWRVDRTLDVTGALRRTGIHPGGLTVTLVPVGGAESAAGRTIEDVDVSLRVRE